MLFGPFFATAVMSLFGDTSSNTHPSPSSRSEQLIQTYQEAVRLLLKDKFDSVINEIDERLFEILSANNQGLFSVLAKYREIIDTIDIGPREIDNSWLRAELHI